ncbi:MAG: hypothetical protein KatS3mg129_3307 [Leptospiraceae bacterium]|nr:MAG: hypothetical protein KatS3mg129_3307 [Leptospiraceae bacterium]
MSESIRKKIKVKIKKSAKDITKKATDISDIYREKTIKESLKPTLKKEEIKTQGILNKTQESQITKQVEEVKTCRTKRSSKNNTPKRRTTNSSNI